ncbi:MAG: ETC complex I subunit [Rhizobiales bacterium]|nr:ETC complex I subunit [Hyphomicrobiales bacterium]
MTVHVFSDSSPPATPLAPQFFPCDAHAVIYRPARSAMTCGKARTREWKLRFERRTPPFIEPLMGWTGGDDTLVQVELSFPSMESAVAYARRQGLTYTVHGPAQRDPELRVIAPATAAERASAAARRQRLEWVEHTLGPNVIRNGFAPGADPAARYADPQDVLHDEKLTPEEKRDLLRRWALDAYLLDLAFSRATPESGASRLQEVIDALIDLDQPPRADVRNLEDNADRKAA